jgi:hypothetical protein
MPELVDEVSPLGGSRQSTPGQLSARGTINETIEVGSLEARRDTSSGEDETIGPSSRGGRLLSERARTMLANIDAHGTIDAPAPARAEVTNDSPPAAAAPAATTPSLPPAPVVTPPAAATAVPDPRDEVIERTTARNRELLAELDKHRAAPPRPEPGEREKALDGIERMYLEDPVGAIRRLQALALGVGDHAHKDVDAELSGLYKDLTARELGVTLDPGAAALREAERNRRMLDRDKRDRRAETAPPPAADPEAERTAKVLPIISQQLAVGKHAERFPLLMTLSGDFDGVKPEELLWRSISKGIATGELDPKTKDDALIDTVAQRIETHYQALADKILKARPSTAAPVPTPTPDATESKAGATSQGPRTITNASASVAPATPPAEKPAPVTASAAPTKYRNEAERRKAIAAKYFDS